MLQSAVVESAVAVSRPSKFAVVVDVAFGREAGVRAGFGVVAGKQHHVSERRETEMVNHHGILTVAAFGVFLEGETNQVDAGGQVDFRFLPIANAAPRFHFLAVHPKLENVALFGGGLVEERKLVFDFCGNADVHRGNPVVVEHGRPQAMASMCGGVGHDSPLFVARA